MKGHICDNCETHLDDSDYGVGQWSYTCKHCGFTYRHGASPVQEQVDKFNEQGMKTKRVDEYHKHGCHFFGKLVVVDYWDELEKDPKWGGFNADVTYDYIAKAKNLVKEKYGNTETLLSIPALVVRLA